MKFYRPAALVLGLCAGWLSSAAATAATPQLPLPLPSDVMASMQGIDSRRIGEHVRFLANDLLEGRGTGTRGGDIAANYIATQFALYGLKPAGDNGSYLAKGGFRGRKDPAGHHRFVAAGARCRAGLEAWRGLCGRQSDADRQRRYRRAHRLRGLRHRGARIHAGTISRAWTSKGKVVLVIVNEPPSKDPKFFNGEALTYYGRWTYKFEEAARKGAVGALIIHRTDLASYGWDVVRNSWSAEQVAWAMTRIRSSRPRRGFSSRSRRKLMSAANLNLDEMIAAAGTRQFQAQGIARAIQSAHREQGAKIRVLQCARPACRARTGGATSRGVFGALRPPRHRSRA